MTENNLTVDGIDQNGYIYKIGPKGVCQGCNTVAAAVSHGHEPVDGTIVESSDDWVRCSITNPDRGRPEVVCLCGSTRFKDAYEAERRRLTMDGKIVHTVGLFGHADNVELSADEKEMLDCLHKRKIDRSDRIHVINVNGYIGDSTQTEIEYAQEHGKKISWLEPRKTTSLQSESMTSEGQYQGQYDVDEILAAIREGETGHITTPTGKEWEAYYEVSEFVILEPTGFVISGDEARSRLEKTLRHKETDVTLKSRSDR